VDAVVFDLGNVLIEWDPRRVVSQAFIDGTEFHAWNAELDRGVSFDDVEMLWALTYPDFEDEVHAFRARWFETLGDVDDAVIAIVRELRSSGVGVFGLTNSSLENAPQSPDVQRVFAELDGVVVSGAIGVLKPEAEIYEYTAHRFGLTPARTWLVDDSAANVAGAEACGWNGILFTDAASLRHALAPLLLG